MNAQNTNNTLKINILPNGNRIYSLNAYRGKYDRRVRTFFDKSNSVYHNILRRACEDGLVSFDSIETTYNKLISHSKHIFDKYMITWNLHNFIAFIQQYKAELSAIGIESFLPMRNTTANVMLGFEVDCNGIYIGHHEKQDATHNKSRCSRLCRHDTKYSSEYFNKWIVADKSCVTDSTIVLRTVNGDGPVLFFNIDIEGPENDVAQVKYATSVERDKLKYAYKIETGVPYFNIRPISYKSWKKLPLTKKIGTNVKQVDWYNIDNTMLTDILLSLNK